jgi:hypothetical protein
VLQDPRLGRAKTCRKKTFATSFDDLVGAGEQQGKYANVYSTAWAVLRLITRSNFCGRCTGKSLGLAPCRISAT